MTEQPQPDAPDVLTVEICPDIGPARKALRGLRTALAPIVIADLRAKLAEAGAAINRVRELHSREPLYVVDCDCPRPDENAEGEEAEDAYADYEDSHAVNADGDTACLKQPVGAECGHCRDRWGDAVPWPCATLAALDQPTQEQAQ